MVENWYDVISFIFYYYILEHKYMNIVIVGAGIGGTSMIESFSKIPLVK